MCETPLETRFMLAETEVRARELSAAFATLDLSVIQRVARRIQVLACSFQRWTGGRAVPAKRLKWVEE